MARKPPYEFLFDHLDGAYTKPMFGHTTVYVDDRLVMFLIDKPGNDDSGVCLATSAEHIPSLSKTFPSLRHLERYGAEATDWRLLPADSDDFEESVIRACKLIMKSDPRIGRIPKGRRKPKRR